MKDSTPTMRHMPVLGMCSEVFSSDRDPAITLVVRVYCWCGNILHLELPRWSEDDCGVCHSVYRLEGTRSDFTVKCVQIDPARRPELRAFLEHTGRLDDAG